MRPNESIWGTINALLEIGIDLWVYATSQGNSGIKMAADKAKTVLSPETLDKGMAAGGDVYFEGAAADAVNRELLEQDLITDETYRELAEEHDTMFEDGYDAFFERSDDELDSGVFAMEAMER